MVQPEIMFFHIYSMKNNSIHNDFNSCRVSVKYFWCPNGKQHKQYLPKGVMNIGNLAHDHQGENAKIRLKDWSVCTVFYLRIEQ